MVVIIAVTIAVTMVEAHGKQSLQNLVNLGRKENQAHLALVKLALILDHDKINAECKMIPQQIRPTAPNCPIKSH